MTVTRDDNNQWKRVQRVIEAQAECNFQWGADYASQQAREAATQEYNEALADLNKWIDKLVMSNAQLKLALSLSDMADYDAEG